jgi:DMSO/TMAO reductase YedYZ molybdopterin-dependent catalytic subunit
MQTEPSVRQIDQTTLDHLPVIGDGSGLADDNRYEEVEVRMSLRNRGIPLEALRYPITPTGLHYLVIHFDIPEVRPNDWKLSIDGLVKNALSLSLDDIKERPRVTLPVTMECAGNGRALLSPRPVSQPWFIEGASTAEWTGTPLRGLLREAGLTDDATELIFTGLDWGVQGGEVQAYQRSLRRDEALRSEVLLAYAMNGDPLPPQHGYPLRLLVPGWYGMTSVKWLARIEAVALPFTGYQMMKSYRYSQSSDDPGEPVTLIKPRALLIPPGIPEFASRTRIVSTGPTILRGRAWAGRASVERVEVSCDDGATWAEAELEPELSPFAWRGWRFAWNAEPGHYTLRARATSSEGAVQPNEQFWTFQGMGNNVAQPLEVLVI